VTVCEVVNCRRAVLMERLRVGAELNLLDIESAAAITEEMAVLVGILRAYVAELKRDAA
jgi:hypothetical protein